MRDTSPTDRLKAMVQRIEPTWTVIEARPAVGGYHLVHKLRVSTDNGEGEYVLKATPADADPTCDDEARLCAVLDEHSAITVPGLRGVVDEDESLPAPFFLARAVPGATHRRDELDSLGPGRLERAAASLGRQLAGLHATSIGGPLTLDGYGFVGVDHHRTRDGGRPSSRPDQILVEEAETDWKQYLHGTVEHTIRVVRDSRFAGVADDLEPVLHDRIDALSGPFSPALCRVDHSIENTVLDPETDAVRAFLDWEFCVAATPAYDLAFAVHSFGGGLRTLIPGEPDWSDQVETALLEGYRDEEGHEVVAQYRETGDCYRLLSMMHAMANFEDWFDQSTATAAQKEAAADPLRSRVRERTEGLR